MLFGDQKVDDGQAIGLVGRFQPNNWTNKEGKEVRGNQFLAFADDIFEPASWDKKEESSHEDELPAWS